MVLGNLPSQLEIFLSQAKQKHEVCHMRHEVAYHGSEVAAMGCVLIQVDGRTMFTLIGKTGFV